MFSMRTIIVTLSILLVSLAGRTSAYTEADNLEYIEKILSRFNNQEKCDLPNYEEIDVLLMSFENLAKIRGPNAESKLTIDQKILAATVLDQWTSFQKYLRVGPKGTVNSSAKLLSYVGKVIEYQKMKFGSSVCEDQRDRRFHDDDNDDDDNEDSEHQNNPLVRYLKHIRQANKARQLKPKTSSPVQEAANELRAELEVESNLEPKPIAEAKPDAAVKKQWHLGGRPYRGNIKYIISNVHPSKLSIYTFAE